MITKDKIRKLIEKGQEGPTLDFKEDLPLVSEVDKAEFVKDVLALSNSSGIAHLIIGIEDGTWKPVGIRTSHTPEELNQILKDKCNPPLGIEYAEKEILHHRIGVIEIKGDNPPYIVGVPDRYGGIIERGTVFVRNFNMNQGASREDLDRIYAAKYATPQADLNMSQEIEKKPLGESTEVTVKFIFDNEGDAPAIDPYVRIRFKNVQEVAKCTGDWDDISSINMNVPTISMARITPMYLGVRYRTGDVVLRVDNDTERIEATLDMQAVGMHRKRGEYYINLES